MSFTYDDILDSVLIFKKKTNERIKGSATIGNLVLDFTKEGQVVGLEIRKASEFFKTMGFRESADKIKTADFQVESQHNGLILFLQLKLEKQAQKLPLFVSIEQPLFATA